MKFVIRSDLRCIYNDHINERLQEDFGNGNGVNKDMRQELGLAAWTEKSSQPSWTPRQVLRAMMPEAPAEKMGFDMMIKDAQETEKPNIMFARRLSYILIQTQVMIQQCSSPNSNSVERILAWEHARATVIVIFMPHISCFCHA
ncbi:uncharacterized protein LOC119325305 [Triticum dicoccoides]|uniref:uncharacterized protein LOC119325305 n=1 Tax=Triticum dicoccoides TaxID=85692 RepID=UPI0018911B2D|nr:uncharacterized protein LOC119325305 [Triticum dicoccoides]